MIEKEFIPYEQALALKELGFNEPCLASYFHAGKRLDIAVEYVRHGEYTVLAPTFSQAFRIFREEHKHTSAVRAYFNIDFFYEIYVNDSHEITSDSYKTYEEAELACLKELIEITND